MKLPADTHIGRVRLAAANLPAMRSFYVDLLGMTANAGDDEQQSVTRLQVPESGTTLVELVKADVDTKFQRRRSPGLYHLAILLPNRIELAKTVRRLVDAGWPLAGASDHGVSEAVYLSDPEGNGIELYADRPPATWPMSNGQLAMMTGPLDVSALLAELDRPAQVSGEFRLHSQVKVGHVHLHVTDLGRAAAFYVDLLGFDVMQSSYPGALFLAAGGYHHHMGLNTWAASAPKVATTGPNLGLVNFAIVLPDQNSLNAVVDRLVTAGRRVISMPDGWLTYDDDGIEILLCKAVVEAS